jgi:hypothetical protein
MKYWLLFVDYTVGVRWHCNGAIGTDCLEEGVNDRISTANNAPKLT